MCSSYASIMLGSCPFYSKFTFIKLSKRELVTLFYSPLAAMCQCSASIACHDLGCSVIVEFSWSCSQTCFLIKVYK